MVVKTFSLRFGQKVLNRKIILTIVYGMITPKNDGKTVSITSFAQYDLCGSVQRSSRSYQAGGT